MAYRRISFPWFFTCTVTLCASPGGPAASLLLDHPIALAMDALPFAVLAAKDARDAQHE
jgi:hypothetical protein